MKKLFIVNTLVVLVLLLTACATPATQAPTAVPATSMPAPTMPPAPTATMAPKTIVDIAVADGRFKTLVTALQAANLVDTLKGAGPFTVFAPTDDAFAKLPAGTVEALLKDIPTLTNILKYHVVSGKVMAADVVKLTSADTLLGQPVTVKVDGSTVMINNAKVVITDIKASNGVIHVIDTVLLPPKNIVETARASGNFKTLLTALDAAGLTDTLTGKGPFTVFAPTDDAFAKLPAGTLDALLKDKEALKAVLLYHVVSGNVMAADVSKLDKAATVNGKDLTFKVDMGSVMVNNAKVVTADIKASNGVIHVIDTVLIPPKDIVETAIADGRFTTLVKALQAAGLVDTLKGAGPFTVFAPTDDAFKKLPAGTLDSLLKDIPTLKNILLYPVVSGNVMAADVVKLTSANTVEGKPVTIKVSGGKVMINNANVIITDIVTSNGVIHVIDAVLIPPQ